MHADMKTRKYYSLYSLENKIVLLPTNVPFVATNALANETFSLLLYTDIQFIIFVE